MLRCPIPASVVAGAVFVVAVITIGSQDRPVAITRIIL
jgi:hypothetical protein